MNSSVVYSCNMRDVHVYFQFPCTLSVSGILNIDFRRSRLIQVESNVFIHAYFQSNHLSLSVLLPFHSVHLIWDANFTLTTLITTYYIRLWIVHIGILILEIKYVKCQSLHSYELNSSKTSPKKCPFYTDKFNLLSELVGWELRSCHLMRTLFVRLIATEGNVCGVPIIIIRKTWDKNQTTICWFRFLLLNEGLLFRKSAH